MQYQTGMSPVCFHKIGQDRSKGRNRNDLASVSNHKRRKAGNRVWRVQRPRPRAERGGLAERCNNTVKKAINPHTVSDGSECGQGQGQIHKSIAGFRSRRDGNDKMVKLPKKKNVHSK